MNLPTSSTSGQPRLLDVQCLGPAGLHRVAYAEWGEADNPRVLLCLHGLSRVGRDFDDLARAMAPWYRVVCPDLVGRGRSDWLRDPNHYQIPNYVSDMVTLIARVNPGTLHWFGTSLGGLVGMALASLENSPIERMLLNDVGPVLKGLALRRIGEYLGYPLRFADMNEAESYIRVISAPFGPLNDAQWRHLTEVAVRADGDGLVLHYDPAIAVPFRAAADANPNNEDQVLWNVYDKVHCRTLVVRGALSDLLTPETHAEMSRRGPHAELAEIAGVGHAPTFMSPEQISIARNFFVSNP